MDWKLFFATFSAVFVAELGDKTQFVALSASSQTKSTWVVWLAVILALALAGTIGVWAGRFLSHLINPATLRYFAGVLFIGLGIWFLVNGKSG